MVAVQTTVHKEHVDLQLAAHNSKAKHDINDVKSELETLHASTMNAEGLTTRIQKPEYCKDKQTKAYAADQAIVSIAHVFYALAP